MSHFHLRLVKLSRVLLIFQILRTIISIFNMTEVFVCIDLLLLLSSFCSAIIFLWLFPWSRMVSYPLPASRWTFMPVLSFFIRPPDTLTIVGRPSSLATTAEWERRLQRNRSDYDILYCTTIITSAFKLRWKGGSNRKIEIGRVTQNLWNFHHWDCSACKRFLFTHTMIFLYYHTLNNSPDQEILVLFLPQWYFPPFTYIHAKFEVNGNPSKWPSTLLKDRYKSCFFPSHYDLNDTWTGRAKKWENKREQCLCLDLCYLPLSSYFTA